MNHRYPLQTVLDMERCNKSELARRTGISRRTIVRWSKHGVTFEGADRLATALGHVAWTVWPGWDEEADARADEQDDRAFRRRAYGAEYRKRPHVRERMRAYRRNWYRRTRVERTANEVHSPQEARG